MKGVVEAVKRARTAWGVLTGKQAIDPPGSSRSRARQKSLNQAKEAEVRPFDLERDIPRYPSYMDGLPAVPRDTVLATQSELLKKIRSEFETDDEYQRKVFDSALLRFAEVVHLLPASESDHHAQPGGLFRHGLEVAHLALKSTHNHAPFARSEYAERRKELNIRFRYAVMVAALCHDIGKPVTDINVMDATGEVRWNPFGMTIPRWATKNQVDRYFVYWNRGRHRRHEPASLTMLDAIMGSRGKEFLTDVPSEILNETLEAITGDASPLNVIAKIVKQADASSTSADKQQTVAVYGGTGIPVDRYYLSAIRRMLKEYKWKPNKPGSPFWVIDKIPFLVWPAAGEAIAKALKQDGVRGIPLDTETIARELLDRNLASPYVDEQNEKRTYWPILPEALEKAGSDKKGVRLQALRLNSIEVITDEVIPSVSGRYGTTADTGTTGGKAPASPARDEKAPEEPADAGSGATSEVGSPNTVQGGRSPSAPEPAESAGEPSGGAPTEKPGAAPESEIGDLPDVEKPPAHSRLKPAAPPKIPDREPSRVVKKEGRSELAADAVEEFFTENGFLGRVLGAFADDLNKMRSASPDIATVAYDLVTEDGEIIEDEKPRIVALRAPDFFADFHPDMEVMRDAAMKSGLFLLNADGGLPFAAGEYGEEWWRLDDFASRCVLRKAETYRRMIARKIEQGDPGAKPKTTRSKVLDDPAPERPEKKGDEPTKASVSTSKGRTETEKRSTPPDESDAAPEKPAPQAEKPKKSAPPRMQVVSGKAKTPPDEKREKASEKDDKKPAGMAPLTPGDKGHASPGSSEAKKKPKGSSAASSASPVAEGEEKAKKGTKQKSGKPESTPEQETGFDAVTAESMGFAGSRRKTDAEKKQSREAALNKKVKARETAVEVGGQKIRVQDYAPLSPGPAPDPDADNTEKTGEKKPRRGGVISVEEVPETESTQAPGPQERDPKTEQKKRLEDQMVKWLMDRWECGVKTFTEKEILEALSELEKRTVRPYEVRTSLYGFGVIGEKLESGESGLRLTQKGAKRLRELNKERSSAVHES